MCKACIFLHSAAALWLTLIDGTGISWTTTGKPSGH